MELKLIDSPAIIAKLTVNSGIKKANLSILKMLLLGILAGMFIGFGAHADIIVIQTLGKSVDVGFAKFLGAAVFPVGIMLVVMAGAELFTGNNLMTLAVMEKEITIGQMLKNWFFVYVGNFIGSVLLALLLSKSGLYGTEATASKAISISEAKISLTFSNAIIRAIFCNVLVVLAVWMQAGAKDMIGKIFALWFPVMLFVLSGYEHSIANMFFIPLGKFLGAEMSWADIWINNLIPVTIGNIIGGSIFIPIIYNIVYLHKEIEMSTNN